MGVLVSMGVNISDIILPNERNITDFKDRFIAVDAYNTLYQFLSIIRQPDGTPLMDSKGRVTSHLAGLLFRTANLLEVGIKPVFVFDGKPHALKSNTLKKRREIKEKAKTQWEEALLEGDMETARIKAQQTSILTKDMVDVSLELLGYFGIPCVFAPTDGEAQASYMAEKHAVWATASQDFDSMLFGTPRLIRNLTVSGKRKLPRRKEYVNVVPEEIDLRENLDKLGILRAQLVDIAILVGTDFNKGVKGIGAKSALKLIKKHETLEGVMREKGVEIENYEEVRNIFLNPEVTENFKITQKEIKEEGILKLLVDGYEFSENRVKNALERLKTIKWERAQSSLDKWF